MKESRKKSSYIFELEWLIAALNRKDFKRCMDDAERRVGESTRSMFQHYHDHPEEISQLIATYHRVRADISRRDPGHAAKKKDFLAERAVVTARKFLEQVRAGLPGEEETAGEPGFEGFGSVAIKAFLSDCTEVIGRERQVPPAVPGESGAGQGSAVAPEILVQE